MKNTTILPIDDQDLATEIFNDQLHQKAEITMIILGGKDFLPDVKKADRLAGEAYFNIKRHVIWIRDRNILKGILNSHLSKFSGYQTSKYDHVNIFTMTPIDDRVADIIYAEDTIDYIRLNLAFLKAGKI
ncbi:MAG: hypothetical protein ACNS60_15920 [Candidatus Cyclobacteriaceae bacterium M2_1C_046]